MWAIRSFLALVLSWVCLPVSASLPGEAQQASQPPLKQCSSGQVEAWGFIDVARASVWLPDCERLTFPFQPPVALRFAYEREVPGDAFAESAMAMLERNMDADTFKALEARFREFNSHYRDTRDGDVYVMLYDREGNLTLWFNDERLTRTQGDRFASHYFRIWFGPKPFSRGLKKALLNR